MHAYAFQLFFLTAITIFSIFKYQPLSTVAFSIYSPKGSINIYLLCYLIKDGHRLYWDPLVELALCAVDCCFLILTLINLSKVGS